MPSRNTIRSYIPNGYYHIYNRGVEKRNVFLDPDDYKLFLYYLFIYLAPPPVIKTTYPELKNALKLGNFNSKVTLHSFVLMPNHFHFLIHQTEKVYLTQFMRRLTNAYTTYFNKKYDRVGALFQGVFKAVLIDEDIYLLHLSRYIHQNPLILLNKNENLEDYLWSSYKVYLGIQESPYLNSDYILQFFSKTNFLLSYKSFVESIDQSPLPEGYAIDD